MKTRGILDDDHGMKEVFGEGNDGFERKNFLRLFCDEINDLTSFNLRHRKS